MVFGTLLTIRKKKFRKFSKNFQKTGKIVKTKNDCKEILDGIKLTKLRNKKILITGSNGLIGSYLIAAIYTANK